MSFFSGKRVLVPGAGLGRLVYEIVHEGHEVVAMEYSLVMYTAMHSFITQYANSPEDTHRFYPHVHDALTNTKTHSGRFDPVMFPDLASTLPATKLRRLSSPQLPGNLTLG